METFKAIKHDIKTVSNKIKQTLNKDYWDLLKYYWFSKVKKEENKISLNRLYDNDFVGLHPYYIDTILKYRKIIPNLNLERVEQGGEFYDYVIKEKENDEHYFVIKFKSKECYACYHVNKKESPVKNKKNILGYKFYYQDYNKHYNTWVTYEPSDKLYRSRKALYEDLQRFKDVNPNNYWFANSDLYGVNKVRVNTDNSVVILKKLRQPHDYDMTDHWVCGGESDHLHGKNHTYLG